MELNPENHINHIWLLSPSSVLALYLKTPMKFLCGYDLLFSSGLIYTAPKRNYVGVPQKREPSGLHWVAVKELKLYYHNSETILFSIYR